MQIRIAGMCVVFCNEFSAQSQFAVENFSMFSHNDNDT